jgi:hypothetical protein
MKSIRGWIAAALVIAAGVTAHADRVRLKSGKVVEGMFIGGDSKSVRVLLDNGKVSEIPLDQAAAVEFDPRTPPAPPTPAPKPAAKPARTTVMVPAGTAVNVRLTQAIDVDVSKTSQTFKAIVDDPIMIGGSVVVPRGASAVLQAAKVQQSGTMKGSDSITLKLNAIGFGGMMYDVAAAYVELKSGGEGKKTGRKIGGGAGLGAIVGGIAGGGEGAAIGAAVGAVGGAIVASGGEAHLKLPAETRLQFQLSAAVNIQR